MENLERKIFLICPVRKSTSEDEEKIREAIKRIESLYKESVYYPKDHTIQTDSIGLNICSQNRAAIRNAKKVILYYDPTSQGTKFDIGMSFMADKEFYALSLDSFPEQLNEFEEFLESYTYKNDENFQSYPHEAYDKMLKRREEIKQANLIEYAWKENTGDFLFDFGMSFMAEKPITLLNREYVESQRTPHKSFQNVLLALDDKYRQPCWQL